MIPCGVHGRKHSSPISIFPALTGVKPSTSFSGAMASMTRFSSKPFGSGSCTSIPWIAGSALRSFTSFTRSASEVSAGRRISREYMPASRHAFSFAVTYETEAGLSPTSITASPGVTPFEALRDATPSAISALVLAASSFPSMVLAFMAIYYTKTAAACVPFVSTGTVRWAGGPYRRKGRST